MLAGTIIACCYHPCMDFLQDFPQYTLISVQNWIKFLLKLLKKKLSPLPPLHLFMHKGIHPHSFPHFSLLVASVSPSTSLILFSWDFCSCIAAPGCWNTLTIVLSMQVIIHCCSWRRLEDITVFSKRSPALSCKLNTQDRKKKSSSSCSTKVKRD